MFGFGNRDILERATAARKLPVREVTRGEFTAAVVAAGGTDREAEMQATANETMGAQTVVGGERLRIVNRE